MSPSLRPVTGLRRARLCVMLALVMLSLACFRVHTLEDGPPRIDRRTKVLGTFDPSQLIVSTGAGLDLAAVPRAELPAPEIVEWGPIGDSYPGTNVALRFNRPMIPLGERAQIDARTFTIDPPIAGELAWEDPTRLVFRPDQPLPLATTFTVRFASQELARTWQFTTTRPEVKMRVVDERLRLGEPTHHHHETRVLLIPSQPLRREILIAHLRAAAVEQASGSSTEVAIDVHEIARLKADELPRFEIRPRERWPAGRTIVLTVDAGLTGELGTASMAQDIAYSFRSAEGLLIHGLVCGEGNHGDGCALGPVGLELSEPVDKQQARHVRISPEPRGFGVIATDEHYERGPRGQRQYEHLLFWGDFEREVEYTLTVDPALRDVHGQALAGDRSFALRFVEPAPSLEVNAFDRSLDLASQTTIGVESRHVEQLELTLAILTDEEHERLLDYDYYGLDFPTNLAEIQRQRIHVAHTGSFGWSAHALDLANFTQGKPGVIAFELRAGALTRAAQGRKSPTRKFGLVQLTRLGVTVVGAVSGGFVRVARLQDDTPVAGASVELIDSVGSVDSQNGERRLLGRTDAEGRLSLPSSAEIGETALLRVRSGDDRVLIEIGDLSETTHRKRDPTLQPHETVRTALLTERPLYLPGERMNVLGWAAIASPYELRGLRPLPDQTKVELRVRDPHGIVIAKRTVVAKRHGKFWASFDLPAIGALGRHRVDATILGEHQSHEFRIADVQPPDFELSASAHTTDIGPGEQPLIELEATYLFGGKVPIERAWHSTECTSGWYRPPGVPSEFAVGNDGQAPEEPFPSGEITRASRRVRYELGPAPIVSTPLACTHFVSATDANARSTNTELEFLLHPPFYLAVRTPDDLVAGQHAPIEVRALRPDGSPAELEHVELTLRRSEWDLDDDEQPAAPQRCRPSLDHDRAHCRLRTRVAGHHEIEVRARVDGHELSASDSFSIDEPETDTDPGERTELSIRAERGGPSVGETATLIVEAPWSSGRALILLGKAGIHGLHELEFDDGRGVLELEIDDAWIPDVDIHVLAIEPGVPPRLHRAMTNLSINRSSRGLSVTLHAPTEATTREQIPIDVEVRDAAGRPVTGHVAVWAIDEAILALAPLELPSITELFAYRDHWVPRVNVRDRYAELLAPYKPRADPYSPRIFDPQWMRGVIGLGHAGLIGSGRGGGGSGEGTIGLASMSMRSNFSSAPFFIADAALDANGRARVLGTLPDNLTTFRIVALATAPLLGSNIEGRSGSADARVRVTRPLVVRASLPRVLRPGDRAELGVVIDNRSGPDGVLELDVALDGGDGVATLLGATRTRVSMPAGAQIRLPVQVHAVAVGEPIFEVQARLLGKGSFATHARDGLRVPVPIEPEPVAIERVAIYGSSLDAVAMLPLALPANIDPRHGGLSVSIGNSLIDGFEDAAAYLIRYPYEGAEPSASRILPLALLAKRNDIPLDVAEPIQHVAAGVDSLLALQQLDGGFAPLPYARASSPHTSAYVSLVLARVDRAGFVIPPDMLPKVGGYLGAELERWLSVPGPLLAQDIEAALLLRSLADIGEPPPAAIERLFERRARLPLFARANLLLAILDRDRTEQRASRIDTLLTELLAHVEETSARARVVSQSGPWVEYWDSDVRTNALLLEVLLRARPDHALTAKLVRGLLDARQRGRWANTQENAYALLALLDYAAIHETYFPWLQGRVWLGNSTLAQIELDDGETGFEHDFTPMAELIAACSSNAPALILERVFGRMYYRIGLDWASTNTELPAVSAGVELRRELRTASGPLGDQPIERGSLLALDVTIEADEALDDLAIEVPIPGGLEAIDFDVGGIAATRLGGGERGHWVAHQELHRDRTVLLADHLEPGVYTTTVFLRAITAGDYRMPAAQAEMMYYPEIYARTTARRVVIR